MRLLARSSRPPLLSVLLLLPLCGPAACGLREGASQAPPTAALEPEDERPLCASAQDMGRLDGQRVRLVGTYRKALTVTKMNRPPEQLGYAEIELQGKPSDFDPRAWDGQPPLVRLGVRTRPDDELQGLDGRQVSVVGTLILRPKDSESEPDHARPLSEPTLFDPDAVLLAEPGSSAGP